MPQQINRDLSNSLRNAFGGSSAAPVPQQPTPVAPPSGGPAAGPSLYHALINALQPNQAFADKAAEALVRDRNVR